MKADLIKCSLRPYPGFQFAIDTSSTSGNVESLDHAAELFVLQMDHMESLLFLWAV